MESMRLEVERLQLNLSAAARDRALLSIGIDPASINPNMLLEDSYMGRLYRVASNLALLGQVSAEDKLTASIGLEIAVDENAVDFWNITPIGDWCSGGACQVRAETGETVGLPSSRDSGSTFKCYECRRKVCKVCCAGKGALLLTTNISKEASSNNGINGQGGSAHGYSATPTSNRLPTLDGVICKECCQEVVLDALILDYVRVLISLRRKNRGGDAAVEALNNVVGLSPRSLGDPILTSEGTVTVLDKLTNGAESLAEFPYASFLYPVMYCTTPPTPRGKTHIHYSSSWW